jgi:hypothetical protein
VQDIQPHTGSFGMDFVHKLLKKRLFSSPMAFAMTLAKHRQSIGQKTFKHEKSFLKERILRKAIIQAEEDYADDTQVEQAVSEAVGVARKQPYP